MCTESLPPKIIDHLVEYTIRLQPCLSFQSICNASAAEVKLRDRIRGEKWQGKILKSSWDDNQTGCFAWLMETCTLAHHSGDDGALRAVNPNEVVHIT